MFCIQCGQPNRDDVKYCTNCGTPMVESSGTATSDHLQPIVSPEHEHAADVQQTKDSVAEDAAEPAVSEGAEEATTEVSTAAGKVESAGEEIADSVTADVAKEADAAEQTVEATEGEAAGEDSTAVEPAEDAAEEAAPVSFAPAESKPAATAATPVAAPVESAPQRKKGKKKLVGIIAALVALAVLLAAAGLSYYFELWGGKTLPSAEEIAAATGTSDTANVKADDVIKALEDKGFKTEKQETFSGKEKGTFLGYVNAEQGVRVRGGENVIVEESAGPGVPKGTVGKQASDVVSEMASMGVTVKYKKVPVSSSSDHKSGEVVATSPSDGQAVGDDKTIYIGVADQDDSALPLDIVGQDVDTVKADLEKKGYTVKTEARLSSKDRVGKVTGSDKLGATLSKGDTVTLYVGTDASGVKAAYTFSDKSMGDNLSMGSSALAEGQWCTVNGDCITLEGKTTNSYASSLYVTSGGDDNQYALRDDELVSMFCVQGFCAAPGEDSSGDGYLINGDTGAFELMPKQSSFAWCGAKIFNTSGVGTTCKNGQIMSWDDAGDDHTPDGTAVYRMADYFTVIPVGTDLHALESSGYFDGDALAKAKEQDAVDTTRPFLLYRDVSQYGITEHAYSDTQTHFTPDSNNKVIAMKPAPSNETAYYLVESDTPDWDSLADTQVTASQSSDDTSSSESNTSQSKDDTTGKQESSSSN